MNRPLGILFAVAWLSLVGPVVADASADQDSARAARLAERNALRSKGQELQSVGKLADAAKTFEQVLAIEREVLGDASNDVGFTLAALANVKEAAGDFPAARKCRQQALDMQLKLHPADDWRVIDARLALETTGRLAQLTPTEQESLRKADRLNRDVEKFYGQGAYRQAVVSAEEALGIRRTLLGEKHPDYATSLNNLALLYQTMGDHARAEPLYRQALEIWKEVLGEKHPDYANSLSNLAQLYRSMGDYARAEPLYRQALQICKEVLGEKHPFYATSLNNLAGLYYSMGDYARAEPLYRQALEIRKEVLDEKHPDYATSLNNLALLYQSMGDYVRAEPLYRQALEIWKEVLDEKHPFYATSLNNLAELYRSMGDYARAEPLYRQALEIRKQVLGEKHPDYAQSLNNLALLYKSMGDYARAAPLYRQALEIRKEVLGEKHPDYAQSLNNLAWLYFSMGDYARAEPLATSAVQTQLASLEHTADAQSTRQQLAMLADVRNTLDSLLSITERTGNGQLAWEQVLIWKGSVAARQRALHALADRPDLHAQWAELQSVTARLGRRSRATPPPEQADAWRQEVAKLSSKAEALQRELAERSVAYRQAKQPITLDGLRAALPDGAVLVDYLEYWHSDPPPKDKPGKLQFERRLVAFVLRREGAIERFELGPTELLAKDIDTWRTTWGAGPEGSAAAATLREKVWAPLEPTLEGATLVIISSDGALGKLPLAALPAKDPKRYLLEDWSIAMIGAPQELVWIEAEPAERKGAGKLLALGDVDYQSRGGSGPGAPMIGEAGLLAGDHRGAAPRGSSGQLSFSPLPGTASELAIVEKLYQKAFAAKDLIVLEKQGATTLALCRSAPGCAYLHLATHGFFAPAEVRSALGRDLDEKRDGAEKFASGQSLSGLHPNLLSGLALAGANHPDIDDGGILTAEDVESLDLGKAHLIVLSACETGLGKSAGGEGLLGLQRAFAAAGARTVVASLWNVDDLVTRDLMERFYTNLWVREMGKLEALREAQLWALHRSGAGDPGKRGLRGLEADDQVQGSQRLSPRYWAAFVLSGDWR